MYILGNGVSSMYRFSLKLGSGGSRGLCTVYSSSESGGVCIQARQWQWQWISHCKRVMFRAFNNNEKGAWSGISILLRMIFLDI